MEFRGKEIKFMRTVQASCDIADMCPGGDARQIAKLLDGGTTSANVMNMAKIIHIMNKGYEDNHAYFEEGYESTPIPVEALLVMDDDDFMKLFGEAASAFYGEKPTIEAEPVKAKKNKAKASD